MGGEKVSVGSLKLAEMILKMRRLEGIRGGVNQKRVEKQWKHSQKKQRVKNETLQKKNLGIIGAGTNNFMCNSTLAGSSSHEQRIWMIPWADVG